MVGLGARQRVHVDFRRQPCTVRLARLARQRACLDSGARQLACGGGRSCGIVSATLVSASRGSTATPAATLRTSLVASIVMAGTLLASGRSPGAASLRRAASSAANCSRVCTISSSRCWPAHSACSFPRRRRECCLPGKIVAGLRVPRKLHRFRLNQCELRESAVPDIVWIHYRVE